MVRREPAWARALGAGWRAGASGAARAAGLRRRAPPRPDRARGLGRGAGRGCCLRPRWPGPAAGHVSMVVGDAAEARAVAAAHGLAAANCSWRATEPACQLHAPRPTQVAHRSARCGPSDRPVGCRNRLPDSWGVEMTDVVIVSATRTPVGVVQRRSEHRAGALSGPDRDQGGARAGQGRPGRGVRGHPGPDPDRRAGPEPGAPGLDQCRRAQGGAGLRRQHPVRLGPEVGGAGLPGDPERRLLRGRRRRPGEHEHGAALPPTCARARRWAASSFSTRCCATA